MDTKKYEIEIDDFEHRMLVQALSEPAVRRSSSPR